MDRAMNQYAQSSGATIANLSPLLHRELPGNDKDVRGFPAWLHGRIAKPRLQATLFPVFSGYVNAIHGNADLLQRFRKSASNLSCSSHYALVRAFWPDTLSGPDFDLETFPVPASKKLTRAVHSQSHCYRLSTDYKCSSPDV
ncbi:hypothetical protein ColTof4_14034 [Colletotrichum tofieldiae]|nr:hypothetical protein ColTof3_14669 [Colletotrichum tofieldiae]GKT81611.1 hypothetical protein ColTof4_14034 [Colletotrichum tofieldiae]GKT97585.1 hypothetical protein Ct61P_15435 [Colletotrichum tofieldiae]